jgi:hypothetical protein
MKREQAGRSLNEYWCNAIFRKCPCVHVSKLGMLLILTLRKKEAPHAVLTHRVQLPLLPACSLSPCLAYLRSSRAGDPPLFGAIRSTFGSSIIPAMAMSLRHKGFRCSAHWFANSVHAWRDLDLE